MQQRTKATRRANGDLAPEHMLQQSHQLSCVSPLQSRKNASFPGHTENIVLEHHNLDDHVQFHIYNHVSMSNNIICDACTPAHEPTHNLKLYSDCVMHVHTHIHPDTYINLLIAHVCTHTYISTHTTTYCFPLYSQRCPNTCKKIYQRF